MALRLETPRFGILEVQESELITFPAGMMGFPQLRRYVLLDNPTGGPFKWLQSVEMPAIAFVTADPLHFFPDYRISVRRADLEPIHLASASDGYVLVVLTVRPNVAESTANLAGPVILNVKERLACQIVLNDPTYHTRHPLTARPGEEAGASTDAGPD
jgi:flagellar assembly factor FliW